MIFFTADTHFRHANIIKYTNRPFENVYEHDNALINNWNSAVKETDSVYHLGDFGFGSPKFLKSIIEKLHGKIYFIRGNHDKGMKKEAIILDKIIDLGYYYELPIQDKGIGKFKVVLCHYPIQTWNKKHFGAPHFHGHSHGKTNNNEQLRLDVGVDCHNYKPISYEEIKYIFTIHQKEKLC